MGEDTAAESTTISGLRNAIKFVDEASAAAAMKSQEAMAAFQELTGMKPTQPTNALDVYRIVCDILEKHQLIGTVE